MSFSYVDRVGCVASSQGRCPRRQSRRAGAQIRSVEFLDCCQLSVLTDTNGEATLLTFATASEPSSPTHRKAARAKINLQRDAGAILTLYVQHEARIRRAKVVKERRGSRGRARSRSKSLMAAAAVVLATQLQVGDRVTIGAGDTGQCARVTYIDANPTGVSWYWLELEQATVPRGILRVRIEQLKPGCGAAVPDPAP